DHLRCFSAVCVILEDHIFAILRNHNRVAGVLLWVGADVYPRFAPTMEWDTAAGDAVARCAGAEVVQSDSAQPMEYNKENLLNPWFIVRKKM
ncbi:MAG: hypothetical protein SNI57_06855, partial [Rikenellaceae bacterium]